MQSKSAFAGKLLATNTPRDITKNKNTENTLLRTFISQPLSKNGNGAQNTRTYLQNPENKIDLVKTHVNVNFKQQELIIVNEN